MVRVRLFAALREQADASRVEASGRTVGEVVDQLSERYGERFVRNFDRNEVEDRSA